MTALRRLPLWLLPVVVAPLCLSLPLFWGQDLLFRDIVHFFVPIQATIARAIGSGHLPQWNPLLYGGTPLFAEPDAGVLYPPNLLFELLSPMRAATVFVVLHLPLAGGGAYLLARTLGLTTKSAVFAGVGFVTSGYLLSMHGGHLYFASAAWLPLATALLVRLSDAPSPPRLAAAAVGVALLVFNGDFQVVVFAAGLASVLALTRAPATWPARCAGGVWILAALCLGAMLGAVQLWPTLLLTRATVRAHGVPLEEAASWPLSPLRTLTFLLPLPFGISYPDNDYWGAQFSDRAHSVPWAPSLYIGPLFALLALSTPWRSSSARARALLMVGALSAILSVGQALPFFAWWHRFVPLANRFRYPEKFALVTTVVLVFLGAMGVERLGREPRLRLFLVAGAILAIAAVVVGFQPAPLWETIVSGLHLASAVATPEQALTNLRWSLLHAAILCFAVALAVRFMGQRPALAQGLLVLLVLVDGLGVGRETLSFGNGGFLEEKPAFVEMLQAALPGTSAGRFWRDRACRYPGTGEGTLLERVRQWEWQTGKENFPELFGFRDAIGYGAAESEEKLEVFHAVGAAGGLPRATQLFGVAAWLGCSSDGQPEVKPMPAPLPRAFVVPPRQETRAQILARLGTPTFDLTSAALVEEATPAAVPGPAELATVVDEQPEDIKVTTQGNGGMLVLVDSFSAGWTATVDGTSTPIQKVDLLWRGVLVPPGEHQVRFAYSTPGLFGGAIISLLGLLATCALLVIRRSAA